MCPHDSSRHDGPRSVTRQPPSGPQGVVDLSRVTRSAAPSSRRQTTYPAVLPLLRVVAGSTARGAAGAAVEGERGRSGVGGALVGGEAQRDRAAGRYGAGVGGGADAD